MAVPVALTGQPVSAEPVTVALSVLESVASSVHDEMVADTVPKGGTSNAHGWLAGSADAREPSTLNISTQELNVSVSGDIVPFVSVNVPFVRSSVCVPMGTGHIAVSDPDENVHWPMNFCASSLPPLLHPAETASAAPS